MTLEVAVVIFASVWWVLAAAAVFAYAVFWNGQPKRQAGLSANLLVITPFLVVPTLFYLGRYAGTYQGTQFTRTAGAVVALLGLVGYLVPHLYLRRNWSLSASIRQGHRLVTNGPYRSMRHPMYTGMTAVVLGSGLLVDNYLIIASTLVVGLVYYTRARKEEALLSREFPEFAGYASKVKMFVPFMF